MDAAEVGRALRCFRLNLLCRKTTPLAESIASVLEMRVRRANDDHAIIAGPQVAKSLIIQLHADATYDAKPLPSLLPELGVGAGTCGAGAEFRLFDMNTDAAAHWAGVAGWHILQPPSDKPHGLRECYLPDLEGYSWVPGIVIACGAPPASSRAK